MGAMTRWITKTRSLRVDTDNEDMRSLGLFLAAVVIAGDLRAAGRKRMHPVPPYLRMSFLLAAFR
jgi:hypothetical protein